MTAQPFPPAAGGDTSHRNWREGARAGLLAAGVGALWSLIVDLAVGHPFRTWIFLGDGFLGLFGAAAPPRPAVAVVVFLAFIAAAFTLLGRIVVGVAHRSDRQPYLIMVANLMVTLLTLGLVVWAAAFQASRLGREAWLQILGSPLIALWTLAYRVYRTHPSLALDLKRAPDS
jgi:hypothetical protein